MAPSDTDNTNAPDSEVSLEDVTITVTVYEKGKENMENKDITLSDDSDCAMCLCPMTDGVCTITPCNHKFHTECMFEFFSKCSVRSCIMCRGEVETLVKDDGTAVEHCELKRLFRVECYGMRFRRGLYPLEGGPYGREVESFFTEQGEVKTLCEGDADTVTIPSVVLELVDSDGNLSTNHGDISVAVMGATSQDVARFENGVAVFEELKCEKRAPLVTLYFTVHASGESVDNTKLIVGVKTLDGNFSKKLFLILLCCVILIVGTCTAVVASIEPNTTDTNHDSQ